MSAEALAIAPEAASDEASLAAAARRRINTHKRLVLLGQVAIFLFIVVGWQVSAMTGFIDQFFFGSPWGICVRLWTWALNGTAYGSFWLQIWVTLEESILGFAVGVTSGVFFGVLLGEVPYLSEVGGP